MKTHVDAFNVENQSHMGKFAIASIDKQYDEWRAKGYGVLLDRDGEICVDPEEPDDDGLYYQDQLIDLEKWQRKHFDNNKTETE